MNTIDIAIVVMAVLLAGYAVSRLFSKKTCDCDQCPGTCSQRECDVKR